MTISRANEREVNAHEVDVGDLIRDGYGDVSLVCKKWSQDDGRTRIRLCRVQGTIGIPSLGINITPHWECSSTMRLWLVLKYD